MLLDEPARPIGGSASSAAGWSAVASGPEGWWDEEVVCWRPGSVEALAIGWLCVCCAGGRKTRERERERGVCGGCCCYWLLLGGERGEMASLSIAVARPSFERPAAVSSPPAWHAGRAGGSASRAAAAADAARDHGMTLGGGGQRLTPGCMHRPPAPLSSARSTPVCEKGSGRARGLGRRRATSSVLGRAQTRTCSSERASEERPGPVRMGTTRGGGGHVRWH
jgi:hypothetical protein